MNAAILLGQIEAAGFSVRADGDRLMVSPPGRLSQKQQSAIRAYKPALLVLVREREHGGQDDAVLKEIIRLGLHRLGPRPMARRNWRGLD